jgi:threonine synthase
VAVPEADLRPMQAGVARSEGGFVSLETAAAVAALPYLVEARRLDKHERVVLFDTGAGFKSEPPAGMKLPAVVPADPSRWDDVAERLANS